MSWLEEIRRQGRAYRGQGGTGIGPGGKNICSTPGMKIRSKGLGRGPIGISWGVNESI